MVYTSTEILLFTNLLAFGSDIVPEARRAQGFALLGISGLLPIGLGSLIGDLVVGDGDFDRLFVLAAGLAVMGWLLAWLLPDIASGTRNGPSTGVPPRARPRRSPPAVAAHLHLRRRDHDPVHLHAHLCRRGGLRLGGPLPGDLRRGGDHGAVVRLLPHRPDRPGQDARHRRHLRRRPVPRPRRHRVGGRSAGRPPSSAGWGTASCSR